MPWRSSGGALEGMELCLNDRSGYCQRITLHHNTFNVACQKWIPLWTPNLKTERDHTTIGKMSLVITSSTNIYHQIEDFAIMTFNNEAPSGHWRVKVHEYECHT